MKIASDWLAFAAILESAPSQKTTVASIHPNDCLGKEAGSIIMSKPQDVVGHDLIDISFEPLLGINLAGLEGSRQWKKELGPSYPSYLP